MAAPDNQVEIDALRADAGRHLGYVRAVARLRPDEPIVSIPVEHTSVPIDPA